MLSSAAPSLTRGTTLRPSNSRITRQGSQIELLTAPASPTRPLSISPRTARSRQLRSYTTPAALPLSVSMVASAIPSTSTLWTLGALMGCGVIGALAWLDSKKKSAVPDMQSSPTRFNTAVLSRCPSLYALYEPLPFLTNRHVETIFAARTRTSPGLQYRRECVIMSDGGCVALDYELSEEAKVRILRFLYGLHNQVLRPLLSSQHDDVCKRCWSLPCCQNGDGRQQSARAARDRLLSHSPSPLKQNQCVHRSRQDATLSIIHSSLVKLQSHIFCTPKIVTEAGPLFHGKEM